MEITLGSVVVMVFVSCGLSVAVDVKVVNFQVVNFPVLKKHSAFRVAFRKCPWVVQENEYVGMRVSELTGECQGFDRSWLLNQTIESGYAYAKKQFVDESFQPPVEIVKEVKRNIPGMLNTGARLDVFISNSQQGMGNENNKNEKGLSIMLWDPSFREYNYIDLTWTPGKIRLQESDQATASSVSLKILELPTHVKFKEVVKVSILTQADSFSVQVEDEEVHTIKPDADMAMLNEFQLRPNPHYYSPNTLVYSIQFSFK